MILIYAVGILLKYILIDYILPAFLVSVIGIGMCFVLKGIRQKKIAISIVGKLLIILILLLIMRSSFIRSRRVVDTEWMIGQTIEQVRDRYYYPKDEHYTQRKIDGKTYTLCNVETHIWKDIWDSHCDGKMYYYVLTDAEGKITDVRFMNPSGNGGALPEHSYFSRWYVIPF